MKLFIGNLSWNTSEDDMFSHFSQFGEITDCRLITDRETGRSRGFGFITYADNDSAQNAMNAMDGTELDGRPLKVNEAMERDRGARRERRDRW